MGKLKQAMIEAQEQFFSFNEPPDLSMDDLIKEDVFFRYGVDIDVAQRVMTLLRAFPPPEHLYVTHPELHVVWLDEYIKDMDAKHCSKQLELFDDGALWAWEK
jgi:hypothetical protein